MTITGNDVYQEFSVNFSDLGFLADDLTKVEPYPIPIVLFSFAKQNEPYEYWTTSQILTKLEMPTLTDLRPSEFIDFTKFSHSFEKLHLLLHKEQLSKNKT